MKGSVAFVAILSYNRTGPVQLDRWLIQPGANVFFELFSQSCGECDVLCQPKWYPEEVSKVSYFVFVTNPSGQHFIISYVTFCNKRE